MLSLQRIIATLQCFSGAIAVLKPKNKGMAFAYYGYPLFYHNGRIPDLRPYS
jgi:hypothetical protein